MPHVFILSSPRSGSTVTRLTLDKLPGFVALPETHFWVFKAKYGKMNFRFQINEIADLWINFYSIHKFPVDKGLLKADIIQNAHQWKDLLDITIEHYKKKIMQDGHSLVICEKSPPHIFYTEQIKKDYPNSKFIFLVRDPRDVVASLKTCGWSTSNPVINSLVWKNGIKVMLSCKEAMIVKYEDLVSDPQPVLEKVCNFLAIDFDSTILERMTEDRVEKNNPTSKNAMKPLNKSFIGNYSEKLSKPDRELEMIEYLCRKEMKNFGYLENENIKGDFKLKVRIFYHKLGILVSKIVG